MQFRFFHPDLPSADLVSVDGVAPVGPNLSHWPGNRTPADLKHEVSTGIVLNLLRRGADSTAEFLDDRTNFPKAVNRYSLVHLVDVFANPVACLLAGIIDYFEKNNIQYTPESIYLDTREGINR